MSSSVRDFTDFNSFPGSHDIGTGLHSMPILWRKDSSKRWRQWQIYVRVIKKTDNKFTSIDWNMLEEKQLPIKPEYYVIGTKIHPSIIAEAWVETGIEGGKITRNAPTYFENPLNKDKANERNVFQNAMVYARGQWLKKKDSGAAESKTKATASSSDVMLFPMLAKPFEDGEKHLVFPLYIQPKLDGNRCLVYLQKKNGGVRNVVAYTRKKKLYPSADYIKKKLYPYLNELYDEEKKQSIYFDGELYKHGKKLQDITGDSRNESADTSDKNRDRNEYHIYDCFYPRELDSPFSHRLEQLTHFYDALDATALKIIKKVPVYLVNNMTEASRKYTQFVKMGYEGAMLRNANGEYLSSSSTRSNNLVKMKPKFTDEFEVVGFTDGSKGKDKGAIIWICKTDSGQFNVTPKDMSYADRYALYEEATKSFDTKYLGRMLTVEYEDLSAAGVPLRAKALTFRDYE